MSQALAWRKLRWPLQSHMEWPLNAQPPLGGWRTVALLALVAEPPTTHSSSPPAPPPLPTTRNSSSRSPFKSFLHVLIYAQLSSSRYNPHLPPWLLKLPPLSWISKLSLSLIQQLRRTPCKIGS
jgi:hypothetical protein